MSRSYPSWRSWAFVAVCAVFFVASVSPAEAQRRRQRRAPAEAGEGTSQEQAYPEESSSAAPSAEDTPWSKGVSMEKRRAAHRLLEQGNALFLEGKHREALPLYQRAIESWDHPAIRFNIVRTLIHLDRPVEAFENLEHALRFGSAPLEDAVYAEAQNYRRLLLGQIAELEVRCKQEGVRVSVDGQEFLTCPDTRTARVTPGSHQVVGKKEGHLTLTEEVVVMPGKMESVEVSLQTLTEATTMERRWKPAMPWLVTVAGAVVAGAGALLQLRAQADLNQYGEDLERLCGAGCEPEDLPAGTANLASRGQLLNKVAIGTMAGGGAIALTGLILVIMNRQRAVLPDDQRPPPQGPQVGASVGPDHIALSVSGRF
jgi:tetratricopeptide (TPR) repeat protein